jgi:hypothetical protein
MSSLTNFLETLTYRLIAQITESMVINGRCLSSCNFRASFASLPVDHGFLPSLEKSQNKSPSSLDSLLGGWHQ